MKTLKRDYSATPSLPEDVIADILSRLPAKYVVRFWCVCKHWLSLTNHPDFIKLHISRSLEKSCVNLILVCYALPLGSLRMEPSTSMYCLQNQSFDEDLKVEEDAFHLLQFGLMAGSCNGLICLIKDKDVMLLNPSTREYKLVKIDNEVDKGVIPGISFRHVVHGLGYDSVMNEYKLVQFICSNFRNPDSAIKIYSLDDSPCVTISHVPYSFVNLDEIAVYLNGALHMVAKLAKTSESQLQNVIISFDVVEKVIREFPLPHAEDKISHATLGVLRGQLCIFCNPYFDIWVMKTYGVRSSWYKLASMDKSGARLLQPNINDTILSVPRLLCISEGGGILLSCDGKLFLYDPEQNTVKHLEINGIHRELRIRTITASVASYVSLKSGTYLRVA